MKFKRQYILTLNIDAKTSDQADTEGKYFCHDIRGYAKNSSLPISVHSCTPKSINPKRLPR
jgi:hypothetical protein